MVFVALSVSDHGFRFGAIIGDLDHKKDVYLLLGGFSTDVTTHFSSASRARYLREHRPDLVPDPAQPGQPPSDSRLGTIFEHQYYVDVGFRVNYLSWLRTQVFPQTGLPPNYSFVVD